MIRRSRKITLESQLEKFRVTLFNRTPKLDTFSIHYTMAKKSKLLSALDAHKNVDYSLQKQKKLQKQAAKRKRSKEPSGFFYKGEPIMSGGLQEAEKGDEVSEEGSNDHPSEQEDGSNPPTAAVRIQSTPKSRLRLTLNSRSIPQK